MMVQKALRSVLATIGRHADRISTVFVVGEGLFEGFDADESAVKALRDARLLWQPTPDEAPRLVPEMRALCERIARDPKRRLVDPNIAGALENLRSAIDDYKQAKRTQEVEAAEMYLKQAEGLVSRLVSDLDEAARLLWQKAESRFGYMASLEMKVKENDFVLQQAGRLNNQLAQILPTELEEWAGHDPTLRRLLLKWLYVPVENCRRQVNEALHRIRGLLYEFRKKGRLMRMVAAFAQHYQSTPTYQPADYCGLSDIPQVFNQAGALTVRGHADLFAHEDNLAEMLEGLRKSPPPPPEDVVAVPVVARRPLPAEMLDRPALLVAVDDFIMLARRSDQWLSGIENAPSREIADLSSWVWMLMTRLDSLSADQQTVTVHFDAWIDPVFSGVRYIRDIHLARFGTDPAGQPSKNARHTVPDRPGCRDV